MVKLRFIGLLSLITIFLNCNNNNHNKNYFSNKKIKNQPNILFILLDDLGKEWVSGYDADDIETPNIDSLLNGGMQFTNVWSMPQCTPSRVTLMTGQYPFRHGWVNHYDVPRWGHGVNFDSNKNPSLARILKKLVTKHALLENGRLMTLGYSLNQ